MKLPNSLSDQELLTYADEHIDYEINMLVRTVAIMGSLVAVVEKGDIAKTCNNAFLSSFSMHARNLIDFLYLRSLRKDRPTDIIVQDYIDEISLVNHLPPITPLLEQTKTKADKQVAHLTFDRIAYEKSGKGWNFVQIATDIMKAFRAIAPVFPEARVSDSFLRLI
jgi:hypothetical protein